MEKCHVGPLLTEVMAVCVHVTHPLACLNDGVVQCVQYFRIRYRSLPSHRIVVIAGPGRGSTRKWPSILRCRIATQRSGFYAACARPSLSAVQIQSANICRRLV